MKTNISQRAARLLARTPPEQTCLRALLIFAAQNPGFEFGNYGTVSSYRADARRPMKDLRDLRELSWRFAGLTNDVLREASRRAFMGRLQFIDRNGGVCVDYCTGQYFPTEFRAAALAVVRCALEILDRAHVAVAA